MSRAFLFIYRVINGSIKYSGIVCHSFGYSTQFQLVWHVHTIKLIEMDTFISKNTRNVSITTSNKECRFVCTQFNNNCCCYYCNNYYFYNNCNLSSRPSVSIYLLSNLLRLPNSTHFLPLSTPSLSALPLCLHIKHWVAQVVKQGNHVSYTKLCIVTKYTGKLNTKCFRG